MTFMGLYQIIKKGMDKNLFLTDDPEVCQAIQQYHLELLNINYNANYIQSHYDLPPKRAQVYRCETLSHTQDH